MANTDDGTESQTTAAKPPRKPRRDKGTKRAKNGAGKSPLADALAHLGRIAELDAEIKRLTDERATLLDNIGADALEQIRRIAQGE